MPAPLAPRVLADIQKLLREVELEGGQVEGEGESARLPNALVSSSSGPSQEGHQATVPLSSASRLGFSALDEGSLSSSDSESEPGNEHEGVDL